MSQQQLLYWTLLMAFLLSSRCVPLPSWRVTDWSEYWKEIKTDKPTSHPTPFPSVEPSATPTRSPFISLDWCSSASTDGTALIHAIEKRNINVVYCLLAKGERLDGRDEKGLTALHHAVLIGQNETALLLISKGADINAKAKNIGPTPLIASVMVGNAYLVVELCKRKADFNIVSNEGKTALIEATLLEDIAIVKILIGLGADLNIAGLNGRTALIVAAHEGYEEIAEMLLLHGADVMCHDHKGRTALMMAAMKGHENIVKKILAIAKGKEIDKVDNSGHTAEILAKMYKHVSIVEIIKSTPIYIADNVVFVPLSENTNRTDVDVLE